MRTTWLPVSLFCLGLGLLLGTQFGSRVLTPVRGAEAGAAPIPGESAGRIELEAPSSEGPRDEGESVALRSDSTRRDREAATLAASEPAEGAEPPPAELAMDPALESTWQALQAEFESVLQRGLLMERLRREPDELGWLLMSTYLECGRPTEAMAMLERYPFFDSDTATEVAEALEEAGDVGTAARAWALSLEQDPTSGYAAHKLVEIDPQQTVGILQQALGDQLPPGDPEIRIRLAEALERGGQAEDARAILEGLFLEGSTDGDSWDLLARLDPEATERRLLEKIAEGDEHGNWRERLTNLLAEAGRTEEALGTIEVLLAENPTHHFARQKLLELDPERGFEFLMAATRERPDHAAMWSDLGEQYLQRGETGQAIESWLSAFRAQPGDTQWADRLQEHAPGQLIVEFELKVAGSENDELWGDMGDAYWRAGRRDDAHQAWLHARMLDPDDGEWSSKLQSWETAQDPLNW